MEVDGSNDLPLQGKDISLAYFQPSIFQGCKNQRPTGLSCMDVACLHQTNTMLYVLQDADSLLLLNLDFLKGMSADMPPFF